MVFMSYYILQSPSLNHEHEVGFETVTKMERVFTTLIRDQHQGLGFSISGGKGAEPFIEGSDAVFISKVAEDGPAAKDAKLMLGDKLIQVTKLPYDQQREMGGGGVEGSN